jgi:hypothetical protein
VTNVATGFGPTYTISAGKVSGDQVVPATLSNARHGNNVGCAMNAPNTFATFACTGAAGSFDVGFGVTGNNNNEIDGNPNTSGSLNAGEFVKVKFDTAVILNGFAGMLTYKNTQAPQNLEKVILKTFYQGTLLGVLEAFPVFLVNNNGGSNFNTVGLAFLDGLKLKVDEVRFLAGQVGTCDDKNCNVTAAGLKVSAVPLPAGVLLLGLGLGGLAAYRRRQAA